MILDKTVEIIGHSRNCSYYEKKGYIIFVGKKINVAPEDLSFGATSIINVCCDNCGVKKKVIFKDYYSYTNGLKDKYYCSKKECKELKIKQSCIKKYGVDNVMKVKEIKNTFKNSIYEKYGVEHYSKTSEFKKKYKYTCIEKYGESNVSKNNVIRKKISENLFSKKESISKYSEKIGNEYNINSYKDNMFEILHNKCCNIFKINRANLYDRINNKNILCIECNPISIFNSGREIELFHWLDSMGVEYVKNDRNILNGKELDIYIKSANLAIEFNGLYWHSELFKDNKYHLNKSVKCLEKGITLLHIWEDEWIFKQEIVKSIIMNKLNKISNKIYARNCEIRIVGDTKDFLDRNHIQGFCSSSIKLGLFYNNELVSLMTFGKRMINKKVEFELLRFCNLLNMNVIGASSKLFNYFKKNYQFEELICYSDFRLFDGKVYNILGFSKKYLSQPDYFWYKGLERKHRFTFNKQKLVSEGFNKNMTEVEIMHERGYYRIFGCGQIRWEYKS
jgi:hypothetical protein